ncbi:MAG TPA: hypothetical protein VKB93_22810 [Thermoanaerobaculia bacterium]|nr:hypothetical protein [Thermoanaerobaculia bacterium]
MAFNYGFVVGAAAAGAAVVKTSIFASKRATDCCSSCIFSRVSELLRCSDPEQTVTINAMIRSEFVPKSTFGSFTLSGAEVSLISFLHIHHHHDISTQF